MADSIKGKATICVVNYKTLENTRLCLRSIRKFTDYPYEVIVVDNDSQDESLEYLKSLSWIRLIERKGTKDISGGYAHGAGLDAGLAHCNTEFFVSMHSDTFVHKAGWLNDLIEYFREDQNTACIGSGKLELAPRPLVWLKQVTDYRTFWRKLTRQPDPKGIYRYYNRTICSIYKTGILRREGLSFLPNDGLTVGKKLYFELVDHGYRAVELSDHVMSGYVWHLAHATEAANINDKQRRHKTAKKCTRRFEKIINSDIMQEIRGDNTLDK